MAIFYDEDGIEFEWKDCDVPGCPNQICISLSDRFCWPHAMSGGAKELRTRKKPRVIMTSNPLMVISKE